MYHTLAFQRGVAGAESNTNMSGMADGYATLTSNGAYLLPRPLKIIAANINGALVTNGRISAPSLRGVATPSISPVNASLLPGDLPARITYPPAHLELQAGEEINVQETATGAGRVSAALWLHDGQFQIAQGQLYTLRLTTGATTTPWAWNPLVMTPETTLPAGEYQCVGLRVTGADFVYARLNFASGGMKPGCICGASAAQDSWNDFRMGNMGPLGNFTNTSIPLLEVWPDAAAGTGEVFMDIIKFR